MDLKSGNVVIHDAAITPSSVLLWRLKLIHKGELLALHQVNKEASRKIISKIRRCRSYSNLSSSNCKSECEASKVLKYPSYVIKSSTSDTTFLPTTDRRQIGSNMWFCYEEIF
ncbi:hypothetical protein KFK09_001288 [Dendrobium nobile]|uniref:Uncharacterized protein n=1 Tax=Dendrobium nobile TaxID=94219 RepID=A0A8T3C4E7_DENNO|nr:hypothetical protein KFK09_001288 [Dendrobium nobile]